MKQQKKLEFLIFWSTCFLSEERNGRLQRLLQLQWIRFELNLMHELGNIELLIISSLLLILQHNE